MTAAYVSVLTSVQTLVPWLQMNKRLILQSCRYSRQCKYNSNITPEEAFLCIFYIIQEAEEDSY